MREATGIDPAVLSTVERRLRVASPLERKLLEEFYSQYSEEGLPDLWDPQTYLASLVR